MIFLVSTGSFEALEITITEYTTTEITLVWGVVTGADRNNLPAGTNYEISISPLDTVQVHNKLYNTPFFLIQWEEKMLKVTFILRFSLKIIMPSNSTQCLS